MKSMMMKAAVVLCAMMAVTASFAQGGQGRGGFGMRGGFGQDPTGTTLLQREDVQNEIKLTSDQKSKLTSAQEEMQTKMRDAFQAMRDGGGDRDAMQKQMTTMMTESRKKLLDVLTDDQKKRLKELAIQRMGNGAALVPELQKDLGITDDQKTKFKDLQDKQQEANRSLREKMQNQEIDREGYMAAAKKNNDIMNVEIGKILTADQKNKLKDMSGKPFTFKEENNG